MTDRREQIASGHTDRGPGRGLLQTQTYLVRVELVVDDDAPDPQPNRAARRALARANRKPAAGPAATRATDRPKEQPDA